MRRRRNSAAAPRPKATSVAGSGTGVTDTLSNTTKFSRLGSVVLVALSGSALALTQARLVASWLDEDVELAVGDERGMGGDA